MSGYVGFTDAIQTLRQCCESFSSHCSRGRFTQCHNFQSYFLILCISADTFRNFHILQSNLVQTSETNMIPSNFEQKWFQMIGEQYNTLDTFPQSYHSPLITINNLQSNLCSYTNCFCSCSRITLTKTLDGMFVGDELRRSFQIPSTLQENRNFRFRIKILTQKFVGKKSSVLTFFPFSILSASLVLMAGLLGCTLGLKKN